MQKQMRRAKKHISSKAKKYPVTQKSRTFVSDALQKTEHYTVCFLNSWQPFFLLASTYF